MKNYLPYTLLISLAIGWIFYWSPLGALWDLHVYTRAVSEFLLHQNPYLTGDVIHQFPLCLSPGCPTFSHCYSSAHTSESIFTERICSCHHIFYYSNL